jgi:N-acetylmuramoyl-L-alanine amidase
MARGMTRMKLNAKYMTRNDCFTAGKKITPKGIMVHSTATPGVMAADWFSRWNKSYKAGETNRQVCVHAFVDDKEVWQYLPWNHRGWHCGGTGNNTHIGIEICEPAGFSYGKGSTMVGYNVSKNESYFRKAWQNAVDLCVKLCREYDLTEEDIICHSEGAKIGIASIHGDVMHWFPKHGESMNTFRSAVRAELNKENSHALGAPGIQIGDVVAVKDSAHTYYPGGATIPAWVKTGSYHTVTQIASGGKPVVKGGRQCVLLGKKVDKKSGKESAGIISWIETGALIVLKNTSPTKKPPDTKGLYRVQIGVFSNMKNAEALLEKLKKAGFEGLIKKE